MYGWMRMEHWLNDSDKGKSKYSEKNLSQCHFLHQQSHTDWPGVEVRVKVSMYQANLLQSQTDVMTEITDVQ
jgi:hypothetical protein